MILLDIFFLIFEEDRDEAFKYFRGGSSGLLVSPSGNAEDALAVLLLFIPLGVNNKKGIPNVITKMVWAVYNVCFLGVVETKR